MGSFYFAPSFSFCAEAKHYKSKLLFQAAKNMESGDRPNDGPLLGAYSGPWRGEVVHSMR